MRIRRQKPFDPGYNAITSMGEIKNNSLMDFGILKLGNGQVEINSESKERAFLLITGEVTFEWTETQVTVSRKSCFDENPWVLHVPAKTPVKVTGIRHDSEICLVATQNGDWFKPTLYAPSDCDCEERGKGTMQETSTRIVRTVFDYAKAPNAKLVLGEVVDYPGKWSSYPPHHHPQPEIYFYKFHPNNGYGFSQLGEDVVKVISNDTVKILNDVSHPQVAAPGYVMYYIWAIRHLDGNPYVSPIFEPEHLWVINPNSKIWPEK